LGGGPVEDIVGGEVDKPRSRPAAGTGEVGWSVRVDRHRQLSFGLGAVHRVVGRAVENDLGPQPLDRFLDLTPVGDRELLASAQNALRDAPGELLGELTAAAGDQDPGTRHPAVMLSQSAAAPGFGNPADAKLRARLLALVLRAEALQAIALERQSTLKGGEQRAVVHRNDSQPGFELAHFEL